VLSPPLSLVANDPTLANHLLSHLNQIPGHRPSLCPFALLEQQGIPTPGSVVLLAAASAADGERLVPLVQEIALRRWPVTVLVVETEAATHARDLGFLDPYIAGRVRWPGQAPTLVNLVRSHLPRALPPAEGSGEDEPTAAIRRQVLATTPSLEPLVEEVHLAASHDVTVFLTGETGTGKTSLARLIHGASSRKAERFVLVPCGALASNLIESELFGHAKGAFTGADRAKVGKFEAAGQGTLLLDEIDTLGLEQQASLLRVVETGEYEPVGSNETRRCAARLVVASNLNLEEAVQQGRFRQDLWYRLNILSIHLPPLRERVRDIGPLARDMAVRFCRQFHKGLFDISAEALSALEAFPWPGNIRQLENAMQQAVLVSKGPQLLREHLPLPVRQAEEVPCLRLPVLAPSPAPAPLVPAVNRPAAPQANPLEEALAEDELGLIQRALEANGYRRSRTAAALGISRVTLYKKMKKYGLQPSPRWPA
jgi:DNA-binding NtrC family response regulator